MRGQLLSLPEACTSFLFSTMPKKSKPAEWDEAFAEAFAQELFGSPRLGVSASEPPASDAVEPSERTQRVASADREDRETMGACLVTR